MRRISTNTYSGQHGLWYVATGQFARWATMNLTLPGGTDGRRPLVTPGHRA